MNQLISVLLLALPCVLNAQSFNDKGIQWTTDLNWDEIQRKAKSENKYIFIDAYATWCSPCKKMDNVVYTSKEVGRYINEHFISVKIQMDSTKKDHEYITNWYGIAHQFKEKYKIESFPTYLFFNSDGNIVHREGGFKTPDAFINVVAEAMDSRTQLYTLIGKFKQGNLDYKLMPALASKVFKILKDKRLAYKIADEYNSNYFNKLNDVELFNKENIEFVTWYPGVLSSKDKFFYFFLSHIKEVDSLMDEVGFTQKVIDGIITREEINVQLYSDNKPKSETPDWKEIYNSIENKYGGKYADRIVLNAKITWYIKKKDWSSAIRFYEKNIDQNGVDTTFWGRFHANNMIYDLIFFHSTKNRILNKAISWMEIIIKAEGYKDAASIDTYANLLYKVGRIKEAIQWEEKAVELRSYDPSSLLITLNKMKRNEPTWIKGK